MVSQLKKMKVLKDWPQRRLQGLDKQGDLQVRTGNMPEADNKNSAHGPKYYQVFPGNRKFHSHKSTMLGRMRDRLQA